MAASESSVNLLDLAASALASVVIASNTIRDLSGWDGSDSTAKNARLKLDGTVVTDADFRAQSIIVQSLQRISPNVRIVGEESPQETQSQAGMVEHSEEDSERIFAHSQKEILERYHTAFPSETTNETSNEETAALHSDYNVDSSRVSVLVDPLDGTQSYATGDYAAVSILIAILLDSIPHFGVIGKPFGGNGFPSILDTGCTAVYGGHLLNGVYIAGGGEHERKPLPDGQLPRAIISLPNKSEGIVRDFVDYLASKELIQSEPIHASGAGEKSLRLVLAAENEGIWFLPKKGTSRWDVAASDALLRAMGGRLSDKYGKDLDYSVSRTEAENTDGVIASNDAVLHAECIRLFLEEKWDERDS